ELGSTLNHRAGPQRLDGTATAPDPPSCGPGSTLNHRAGPQRLARSNPAAAARRPRSQPRSPRTSPPGRAHAVGTGHIAPPLSAGEPLMQSSRLTRRVAVVIRARSAAVRAAAATPCSATLLVTVLLATSLAPAQTQAQGQGAGAAATPERIRAAVDAHRARHELAVIEELRTLLAVPHVAADLPTIRRNAELLVQMLERRGVRARLPALDGDAPPAVYGELTAPGATRTVVLYAHYDGQPVEGGNWATPPWEPTLRAGRLEDGARVVPWPEARAPLPDEWRIYGRSASDDKSPIVAYLAALDALTAAGIAPSVNLKFFLEGEEEAGSPNLRRMLE